ncbi:MAG: hypothetical protein ACTSSG_08270 [Candidatus Heimdallarchaeaceae archaeon]
MMRRKLTSRRGVSSIIATLVIFTVMLSALGLALSQIIPSLERFQTQSDLTAATNMFLAIDSEVKSLMNMPDNSSSVIRYNLGTGIFDIKAEREIFLIVKSGGENLLNYSVTPGEAVYRINGNFKGLGGMIYDFGSPLLLVYSLNRTAQMTNIVHQSYNEYKLLKLFYNIFLNIKKVSETAIEVNFIVLHLITEEVNGQSEYFPVINTQTKIQITKRSQNIKKFNLGEKSDDLSIEALTADFSQLIIYPIAPAAFTLSLNIISINIDFRTT